MSEDRWRSVDEIARYIGVSRDTIYTWVAQKGLPGHKVGRFWKFKKDEIDSWMRSGTQADVEFDAAGRDSE